MLFLCSMYIYIYMCTTYCIYTYICSIYSISSAMSAFRDSSFRLDRSLFLKLEVLVGRSSYQRLVCLSNFSCSSSAPRRLKSCSSSLQHGCQFLVLNLYLSLLMISVTMCARPECVVTKPHPNFTPT